MTYILSHYKQEDRNMKFLIWMSSFCASIGLFFMGTIFWFGIPDLITVFILGTLINGCAGALALNNGVAATVEHLWMRFPGSGETVNNITSGIFVFFFSLGEMIGPILGSLLTSKTGSFSTGIAILNCVMILWTILTSYHLGGSLLFKGSWVI